MQTDPQKVIDCIINRAYPYEPHFYGEEPPETITLIAKITLEEDDSFEVPQGTKFIKIVSITETERDYGYGPDHDEVEIEFHGDIKPNLNYVKELTEFDKRKKEFAQEYEKWKAECAEIDRKANEKEKAMYNKLKEKYAK